MIRGGPSRIHVRLVSAIPFPVLSDPMVKRTAEYVLPGTLAERGRVWLDEVRGAVAPRPHLVLDPPRCALLVIDMLRYFADPSGRCYLPATAATAPQIAALVDAWRRQQGMVVFTRHCHQGEHDLGMLGRFFSDYIHAGEAEAEIIDLLAPRPGEDVIPKTTYDAFIGTALGSRLEARGVTQVLVTGVLTHMCCETTARSAFCRGYEVYVAADACAANNEARHIGSLLSMAESVAIVMSTHEVLARCRIARESS